MLREINLSEIPSLLPCIIALSDHHNRVSLYHQGSYPTNPPEKTVVKFTHDVTDGTSRIAVVEEDSIVGFCKVDVTAPVGKLDWLIVLDEYRGKGYGTLLMNWAMDVFREAGISQVEVKVVAGNDAVHLYEKYGFQLNAYILRKTDLT